MEEIVKFIDLINEYLEKEDIWDLMSFISKTIKDLKDELIKKINQVILIRLLIILKMGLKNLLI